jgi:hypothetical protein
MLKNDSSRIRHKYQHSSAQLGPSSRGPTTRSARISEPLGTKARRLQRRILLRDRSLKGVYWIVDQFLARPIMNVVRIVPLIIGLGAKVRREHGTPIRRQILDMLRLGLVHGAKPRTYYMTERYREGAMRDADALVMRNETKHGLFKALNRLDVQTGRTRSLGDKLEFARWCAETGIPHPQPILVVEQGAIAWHGGSLNDLDQDLFVKRRRSRGTRGVATYRRTDIFRYLNDKRQSITLDQLFNELLRRSRSERLIAQPCLHNHPMIADLADEALIVFRLMTCLDEDLRPVLTNAYLRLMAKLEPNWDVRPIREFFAPIDLERGVLGQLTGDRPECLSEWSDHHPVSGAMVAGRTVPFWHELARLATRVHSLVPGRVMVGWDIALTTEGPVVLEGNSFTDVLVPQRVFRMPLGHMRLGELLDFHLDRLEAMLEKQRD